MLAIIGGRGLTQLANLKITHQQVMRTPYGEPSGAFMFGTLDQHEVIFLARHGYGHTIPPHLVNYRANLWVLREQGASKVISVATVGGIRADLKPGVIVVPDQIIDYTHGRDATYFEARDKPFSNADFTFPYSSTLRSQILRGAKIAQQPCAGGGVYAATQGPRLDSIAEVNRYERDGADMVGMTGMPEAALAKNWNLIMRPLQWWRITRRGAATARPASTSKASMPPPVQRWSGCAVFSSAWLIARMMIRNGD